MQSSLSFSGFLVLFGTMFILAIVPGISVITVSTRSATYGFTHGLYTTIGIATADIFYILLAILGLSFLADSMADLFIWVKYLGGLYLIWLGVSFFRTKPGNINHNISGDSSLWSSFFAGFILTIGDQKAILFYLAFFPTVINLSTISIFDSSLIILIDVITLFITKLGYAYMADRSRQLFVNSGMTNSLKTIASGVLISLGIFLIIMAQD